MPGRTQVTDPMGCVYINNAGCSTAGEQCRGGGSEQYPGDALWYVRHDVKLGY